MTIERNMEQPRAHVNGFTFTNGYYNANKAKIFKGAELQKDGTPGVLLVHLIKDAADSFYPMPLVAEGSRVGAVFDTIKEQGSTVTASQVTLFERK
jgi:hypothetical protein